MPRMLVQYSTGAASALQEPHVAAGGTLSRLLIVAALHVFEICKCVMAGA